MTFRSHMLSAIASLEAALKAAEQDRDRAVFQLARGVRSQLQLIRLAERVALVHRLWRHAHELLPPGLPPQGESSRRAS
jgi:hypothetical protein